MKKVLIITITLFLLFPHLYQIETIGAIPSTGRIIRVDDDAVDDPDNDTWNTITKGLEHANRLDIIEIYNGTYYENILVDKDVELIGQFTDLFGSDEGGVIVDGGYTDDVITVSSPCRTIKQLIIQHSGTEGAGIHIQTHSTHVENCMFRNNEYGIICTGGQGIIIEDNSISETEETGIFILSCNEDIIINNNSIINTTGEAIGCKDSTKVYITENYIYNNNGPGIELYDDSQQNEIEGNIIEDNSIGIKIWKNSNDNIIYDNIITNSYEEGISIHLETSTQASHIQLTKNQLIDNSNIGISLFGTKHVNISENLISGSEGFAFLLDNANYTNISSNNIFNNERGIWQTNCIRNDYSENTISDNIEGIVLSESESTDIINNICINNTYGINIENSIQTTIRFNTFISNNDAIRLSTQANNNMILDNLCLNTSHYAIHLSFAKNNKLIGNTIKNTDDAGLYLELNSNDNEIYHNNFIENNNQVYDTCENQWGLCEMYGGNYWSDYTGVDVDVDGQGDMPYEISGGDNLDECPFMVQDGWELLPMLSCTGQIQVNDVKPGETVTGSFQVANIGAVGSLLDWNITSYPTWGEWSFTPTEGIDLAPENGAITVSVSVTIPDEPMKAFTGTITIENVHNPNNVDSIPISVTTPKLRHPVFHLLNDLLARLHLLSY